MRFPEFFAAAPRITVRDPLARLLGAAEDGVFEYTYADTVKLAGHSCPTVASAYLMTRAAMRALYPDTLPERGGIRVELHADRLEGVKWRNWKLVFYEETRDWFGTPSKLTLPKLFNLATDPKEEYPEETLRNTWAMVACLKVIRGFNESLKTYPAIPEGTADPYVPPAIENR